MAQESAAERALVYGVRSRGGMTEKFVSHSAGVPDRIVILYGRTVFVELKAEKGATSALQQRWHGQARACGADVYVLHGLAEVRAWLSLQDSAYGPEVKA